MTELPTLPAALADAALVTAKTAAAVGSVSESWWHDAVARKGAPKPAIQSVRCTRWRATDVREFWLRQASVDPQVTARAAAASAKARSQRQSPTA
jgi:predicted DNA-binding transcriptional regulator AlpA